MAQRGAPLPFAMKQAIKTLTAAGAKIKPLARELGVSKNTAKKYRAKA